MGFLIFTPSWNWATPAIVPVSAKAYFVWDEDFIYGEPIPQIMFYLTKSGKVSPEHSCNMINLVTASADSAQKGKFLQMNPPVITQSVISGFEGVSSVQLRIGCCQETLGILGLEASLDDLQRFSN